MQDLLFPEFSPSELEQRQLNRWVQRWMDRFPALDLGTDAVPDDALALRPLATPLGPMLAAMAADGLALLEFVEKNRVKGQLRKAMKARGGPLLSCSARYTPAPGSAPSTPSAQIATSLDHLQDQVDAYFAGELTAFDCALAPAGTEFQRRVWTELLRIPFGEQTTYGQIAHDLESPTASRAVGAANGSNPIAIIQPCHRVVGANGTLTGYASGIWRKRRLLEMEADMLDREGSAK